MNRDAKLLPLHLMIELAMRDSGDALLLSETGTGASERNIGLQNLHGPPLCRLSSEIVGDRKELGLSS